MADIFKISKKAWQQTLQCPQCDGELVHMMTATTLQGGKNEAKSATTIGFWCEEDEQEFEVVLQATRGRTFVHIQKKEK